MNLIEGLKAFQNFMKHIQPTKARATLDPIAMPLHCKSNLFWNKNMFLVKLNPKSFLNQFELKCIYWDYIEPPDYFYGVGCVVPPYLPPPPSVVPGLSQEPTTTSDSFRMMNGRRPRKFNFSISSAVDEVGSNNDLVPSGFKGNIPWQLQRGKQLTNHGLWLVSCFGI